jgi:serine phosphatase RsbU (regulator of sigma subunit)
MLLIFLNFRAQQESVYNEQVLLAIQGVRDISNYMSSIETQLLSAGQNMEVDTSKEAWEVTGLELINANYPNLQEVAVFDLEGAEIIRVTKDRTFEADSFTHMTDDPLIERAIKGLGSQSDITTTGQETFFTIALPLRNIKHSLVGAIRAKVNAMPIQHTLRLLGRGNNSFAYLVNDTYTPMLFGDESKQVPDNLAELLNTETESLEYRHENSRVLIYENNKGEAILSAFSPINPGSWSVVVEQPVRIAFSNVWSNMILLGILIAFVGLLALAWGLFQAQQFLRPLAALREGAEAFGSGKLDHTIQVNTRDEMDQLAQTFNHMAERLQASLTEIENQNERLREGLNLARDIQMGLLPSFPPWNNDSLSVHAVSIPASEVGGDFYSYLALSEDQAAICIGDISGKGVGAALMMALTSSMIETQARQSRHPSEMLQGINDTLLNQLKTNHMNAAMLYAIFDMQAHIMTVANAGMIAPILLRLQTDCAADHEQPATYTGQFIDTGGLPIGSMPQAIYTDVLIPLEPGDILLFMSDGIVEAHNSQNELFGFERLEQALTCIQTNGTVYDLVDLILGEVKVFIGDADQHDDITIVAVRPTLNMERKEKGRETEETYAAI